MRIRLIICFMALLVSLPQVVSAEGEPVVVYSARNEHLIKPLFDLYTKETGVKIEFITDKAGALLERLKAEGANTPADLFITVDAGNLWQAAQSGVLQPVESTTLQERIPAHLRDTENHWFGLSVRARTLIYNTNTDAAQQLSTYEDLTDPRWQGKLILRTSKKVYNQSLVASMIAEHGAAKTEEMVRGWVNNLAITPTSNDTKALEAVAAGLGEVTVVNTYYFGRLQKKNKDLPLAVFWPNQEGSGVHVNVSGAGVTKHSKNKEAAVALLEWLASEDAQELFAGLNMEYPVNPDIALDPLVAEWGDFKQNTINVSQYGELQAEAIKLMDRAGYK